MILDTNALSAWAEGLAGVETPLRSADRLVVPSVVLKILVPTFEIRHYQLLLMRPVPLGITHVPICVPVLSWLRSSQATSARGRRAASRLLPQDAVGAGAIGSCAQSTSWNRRPHKSELATWKRMHRKSIGMALRSRAPPSARRIDVRSANPNIATLPPSYRRVGVAKIETMLQEIFGDPVRSKEIGELAPALTSLLTAPCVTDCSWSGSDT